MLKIVEIPILCFLFLSRDYEIALLMGFLSFHEKQQGLQDGIDVNFPYLNW